MRTVLLTATLTFPKAAGPAAPPRARRGPITSPYRAGVCLRSADDRDPHAEVVGPGLPEPVGREGRARQAASEGKADAVGQAQARTVAVERSCQASIQTPEGTDCDAQGVEGCVHVFGRHALAGGLLEGLGVVDGAGRGVVFGCCALDNLRAGLADDQSHEGRSVKNDHSPVDPAPGAGGFGVYQRSWTVTRC